MQMTIIEIQVQIDPGKFTGSTPTSNAGNGKRKGKPTGKITANKRAKNTTQETVEMTKEMTKKDAACAEVAERKDLSRQAKGLADWLRSPYQLEYQLVLQCRYFQPRLCSAWSYGVCSHECWQRTVRELTMNRSMLHSLPVLAHIYRITPPLILNTSTITDAFLNANGVVHRNIFRQFLLQMCMKRVDVLADTHQDDGISDQCKKHSKQSSISSTDPEWMDGMKCRLLMPLGLRFFIA